MYYLLRAYFVILIGELLEVIIYSVRCFYRLKALPGTPLLAEGKPELLKLRVTLNLKKDLVVIIIRNLNVRLYGLGLITLKIRS